jgi:hypothetical protein
MSREPETKRQWSGEAQPGAVSSERVDARRKPADYDLQGKPILGAKPLNKDPHGRERDGGELGFTPEVRKKMGEILARKR